MKYISIGGVCNVKYQIRKNKYDSETLFFDWLITSIESVIKILSTVNINNILFPDNIIRDKNDPYYYNNSRIIIKSLDLCVSTHDLGKKYTKNCILDFINKYERRFNRIIEIINSNEKIIFIRHGTSVDDNIRYKFIETILKINPKCNFTLVTIDDKDILSMIQKDWKASFLNWKKIFLDIENNLDERSYMLIAKNYIIKNNIENIILPKGSWIQSAKNYKVEKGFLYAELRKINGKYNKRKIKIIENKKYDNIDGNFK